MQESYFWAYIILLETLKFKIYLNLKIYESEYLNSINMENFKFVF